MKTITIEIPDHVDLPFAGSNEELARALRIAAAIQWYRQELISQGKAAEIASLSRADFLDALYHAKVPACQVSNEDLKKELESWHASPASRRRLAVDLADQGRMAQLAP